MTTDMLAGAVLGVTPRILGLADRNPGSGTFGCCERYYWKYKLHDYPNARFQEAALLMAMLHATPFEGNPYHGKDSVARWAVAACRFWLESRNRDGSCQEAYPLERSFCATSFSTWCVCQALQVLRETEAAALAERFLEESGFVAAVRKSGQWLMKHLHFDVANQAAAAAVSLQSIAGLSGETEFAEAASAIVSRLLETAGAAGRFVEYDGFDLGYASITMSCLCWYARLSGRQDEFSEVFGKICAEYDRMIDQEGRYDPSGMSRGTTYLYPHAFALHGEPVMAKITVGLKSGRMLSPAWLDDRYCIGMATDYMSTLRVLLGRQA